MEDNKRNHEIGLPSPEPPSSKSSSTAKIVCLSCFVIVLIIFAALAAVLFPVFNRARIEAGSVSCLSNTKQLATCFMMYMAENDERMPVTSHWVETIDPYMKSKYILKCPSVQTSDPCYAFNSKLMKTNTADMGAPQDTVLLFESIPGLDQCGGKELLPSPTRHAQGHSIGFVDGHAKSIQPVNIDSLIWDVKIRTNKSTSQH